jgi:hypothetical protein
MAVQIFLALLGLGLAETAYAQFTPTFLQNASYWGDGKSEIDFYQADFARDGQTHSCELMIILTPKFVDPISYAPVDDPKRPGALPAIEMHEFATVPRGLVAEQRSIMALWRMDTMSLAQIADVGMDGFGHLAKIISEKRGPDSVKWKYSAETYQGSVSPTEIELPKGTALFYDELPLRVRLLDFSKTSADFEVQLSPSLATPQKDLGDFKPAKISWKIDDREIAVDLVHAGGRDHFVLDHDFPFLLREWQMADGSRLKMKNSIRADYRSYLKNGDRERALKDPMLRHPD